jgi:uncharacterized protein
LESNGAGLLVEHGADGEHFYDVTVRAAHGSAVRKESDLGLPEESEGTQRLLDLIPALYQIQPGKAVYFIDEDASAATHLYPLTEFNERRDLQVRKGYLGGRFGAVPFLGGMDHLVEAADRRGTRGW